MGHIEPGVQVWELEETWPAKWVDAGSCESWRLQEQLGLHLESRGSHLRVLGRGRGMVWFAFRLFTLLLGGGWIGGEDGVHLCWGPRGGPMRVGTEWAELGDPVDVGVRRGQGGSLFLTWEAVWAA